MDKLLIGLILLLLNIGMHINGTIFNIIIDFLGYVLLYFGANELEDESSIFRKTKSFISLMACSSILKVSFSIMNHILYFTVLFFLVNILVRAIFLYVLYLIITGIQDMEYCYDEDMNSDMLYPEWRYLCIFSMLSYVLFVFPNLAFITVIISIIIQIVFLFSFYKSTKMFHQRSFLWKESQEAYEKEEE